jgi:hypothetical protein
MARRNPPPALSRRGRPPSKGKRLEILWTHDLSKSRKLKPKTAACYPKAGLTFSDAIAAVRREIWGHQISFMSRPHRDTTRRLNRPKSS